MSLKFLGIIIMASQLITDAHGVNHKRLEFEADTYQQRIWSGVPSDEKMIKRSLSFMHDGDTFDPKYVQPEVFGKFYEDMNKDIRDDNFLKFSVSCKKIFEESENDKNKAAVHMLLQKVSEKSLKHLSSLKKLEKFKSQYDTQLKESEANDSLEYFLNIDKVTKKQ